MNASLKVFDCKVDYTNSNIMMVKNVKSLLISQKQTKQSDLSISDTYQSFMETMLELGTIYSSFVENIFANMFIKDNTPIRYLLKDDPKVKATFKLNYKKIYKIISKLLGLIYEPNSISISIFGEEEVNNPNLIDESNTIFERLWKGIL